MRPLEGNIQSLTTQKDALLAEKTALKNEVCSYFHPRLHLTIETQESISCGNVTHPL